MESHDPAKWEEWWPRRNGCSCMYATELTSKHFFKPDFSTETVEYLRLSPSWEILKQSQQESQELAIRFVCL